MQIIVKIKQNSTSWWYEALEKENHLIVSLNKF